MSNITRSPETTSICFSVVTVNDEHRKPEFNKVLLIKFQALRPAKFLYKKRISLFHYLKETSKHVFSHEYCKIFDSKPKVASVDLLF